MDDPLILAIETATRSGSVAIAKGRRVLASQVGDAAISHSANLIEMIETVLRQADARLSDIDLFAVAHGPGSFTGLRIGLATVKALAVCTGRRVAGVSTLAAIAHAARSEGQVVSLLPAGRGEVFAQMFSAGNGNVKPIDSAAHLSPPALLDKYGQESPLKWAGEGAHQQLDTLRTWAVDHSFPFNENAAGDSGWSLLPELKNLAPSIAAIALTESGEGKSLAPNELKAVYVRASDAEINQPWPPEKMRS